MTFLIQNKPVRATFWEATLLHSPSSKSVIHLIKNTLMVERGMYRRMYLKYVETHLSVSTEGFRHDARLDKCGVFSIQEN